MAKSSWPRTSSQRLLFWAALLCYLSMIFYLIIRWGSLPEEIPTHFGFSGQPDSWGGKSSLLVLPIIGGLLYGMMAVIERFPSVWNTPAGSAEERDALLPLTRTLLLWDTLVLNAVFCYLTVRSAQARPLSGFFLPATMLGLFGSIVWYLLAVKRTRAGQRAK